MHDCIGPTCNSSECQGAELRTAVRQLLAAYAQYPPAVLQELAPEAPWILPMAAALAREGEMEWEWIVRALTSEGA